MLKKALFEPMNDSDWNFFTFKTVFLMALASGRRRSEMHALDFALLKWLKNGWLHIPYGKTNDKLLAKNPKITKSSLSEVKIPSIKGYLGPDLEDTPDKYVCPVQA